MDPFDRQIVAALEEKHFDPHTFEACMGDLLRTVFPGLVPVPGGNDDGIDGAIADGRGEPYPLVCTSAKDVIGNLTRSLDSYVRRGHQRRDVALATSQQLTPQRRFNLDRRAADKGFQMLQVFDQRAIADRLYSNSRWCRDLLGLTGKPSALSRVPKTRRPLLDIKLVGRDADVQWLEETAEDRLLYGPPGSGKTYLARHLAKQGRALFLTSTDESHIAEALREQHPEIVVVDDAHSNYEQLAVLRLLRDREIGARFSILAISWPGGKDRVAEALGALSEDRIRRLELLSFQDIVEVIRETGLEGPDEVIRVLADQAANKPGLAVTLALLCLQGDWQKVVKGEALRTTLMPLFEDLVGRKATPFLAAIGLGGDRGMSLAAVEEALGLPSVEIWEMANHLAAGGVLAEVETNVLAVWPRDLRSALLRQVYFGGSLARPDYRSLLEQAPSFPHAVQAVLRAVHREAEVPAQELRELVLRSGPTEIVPGWSSGAGVEVWRMYTALGEEEARWALKHYPKDPVDLAREALLHAPRVAIAKLLERSVDAVGQLHSQPSHPLRILKDWIEELDAEDPIQRRKDLVRRARAYLRGGGDHVVGCHALFLALSPRLEGMTNEPLQRSVTLRSGLLSLEQIREMSAVWEEARDAVGPIDAKTWPYLSGSLWNWIYPSSGLVSQDVPEEFEELMPAFAGEILRDLAAEVKGSPGLAAGLTRLARRMDLDLSLDLDPVFELLYPKDPEDVADMERCEAAEGVAIRQLATQWISESQPSKVAKKLAWFENEADLIAHRKWPPRPQELCGLIAADTPEPARWLDAFIDSEIPSRLVQPFLEKTVTLRTESSERSIERSFRVDALSPFAASLVLGQHDSPEHLRDLALANIADFPWMVRQLCSREQTPVETLQAMLLHKNWEIAVSAAIGTWLADPRGEIREALAEPWRAAILRASGDEDVLESAGVKYWLSEILKRDPEIAFSWLRKLFREHSLKPFRFRKRSVVGQALDILEIDHRLALLEFLDDPKDRLLVGVVGRELVVYQKLLSLAHLRPFHMEPLEGGPDVLWAKMALLALAEEHDPQEVARATFGGDHSWVGGQEPWRQWDQAFAELEGHCDEDLREVARHGRAMVQELIQFAAEKLQRDELQGP
jgi:hypothetical protein